MARHERWVTLARYTSQLNAGSVSHCSGKVSRQALATPVHRKEQQGKREEYGEGSKRWGDGAGCEIRETQCAAEGYQFTTSTMALASLYLVCVTSTLRTSS